MFCGKFRGCVRETIVKDKCVLETEYKATLIIKNVNCSQKTAYLITAIDCDNEFTSLAFLENIDNKPVLRSITENGNGITSTYYDNETLIHQVSTTDCDSKRKAFVVKYYKLKKC
jgi:hypothetical protein